MESHTSQRERAHLEEQKSIFDAQASFEAPGKNLPHTSKIKTMASNAKL